MADLEAEEVKEVTAPEVRETSEVPDVEPRKSLRDEIKGSIKAIKERDSDVKEPEEKAEKPKKDIANALGTGKPSGLTQENLSTGTPKAPKEVKPDLPAIAAPISWKAETKAKWDKIPREIQEEVNRRESEMEKKIAQVDEERQFGRKLKDVVNPYMPLINSSNSTPDKAIGEMLNYAHILQTGSPAAKAQLLWSLAQRWGADMKITPQVATQPGFQLQTLQQELATTKQELARLPEVLKQQQEETKLKAVVDAFAADPKNIHYEKVKPVMASLLTSGGARDMQDAYDQACYANPDIRSSLLIDQQKAQDAKRIAEKKAKAEAARNASSSIKGSASINGAESINVPKRSLREELRANFRSATEH